MSAEHAAVRQVEGVGGVSDLHIWSLKPGIPLLAAHVTLDGDADGHAVQAAVTSACRRLGISHTTIQARRLRRPPPSPPPRWLSLPCIPAHRC